MIVDLLQKAKIRGTGMEKSEFADRVKECEKTLYRAARCILGNNSDCEDAVADAILSAWQKLDSLRDESFFRTWITRILINECKMRRRKYGRFLPYDEDKAELIPSSESGDDYAEMYAVRHAIDSLDEGLRLAVVLYYIEGYSALETASMMKLPCGTVKSRLSRARKKLKEYLSE